MLKNINLKVKLNILLSMILLGTILTISTILSAILQNHVEEIVATKASLVAEMMNSVRDYTSTEINPELSSKLETEKFFLPQTVPAYSAREVFENLRNNEDYQHFFYKEATLNPTNTEDRADTFEAEIIKSFKEKSNLIEQQYGFREIAPRRKIFYLARPLKVDQESCLRCHGLVEDAPASLVATYGRDNGFGWKMNEIVGAQIISVPASEIQEKANNLRQVIIGSTVVLLILGIILLNIFLKYTIANPINKMSFLSKHLSTGDFSVNFDHQSNDEIGILSRSLNRLKANLKMMEEIIEHQNKS